MKKIIYVELLLLIGVCFISCGSTPVSENPQAEAPSVQISDVEEVEDVEDVIDVDDVIDIEEVVNIVDDEEDDEEYLRSTIDLVEETVTKEEFSEDKAQILKIIDQLKDIMEREDVKSWMKYIDPASINYYSSPANIRKAQKKLPDKTIVLNGIGDYFKYVFIPSRKRSEVKEIRYISKNNIKAVNVKSDNSIIVYYQFVKINNKWLVHIPTL